MTMPTQREGFDAHSAGVTAALNGLTRDDNPWRVDDEQQKRRVLHRCWVNGYRIGKQLVLAARYGAAPTSRGDGS